MHNIENAINRLSYFIANSEQLERRKDALKIIVGSASSVILAIAIIAHNNVANPGMVARYVASYSSVLYSWGAIFGFKIVGAYASAQSPSPVKAFNDAYSAANTVIILLVPILSNVISVPRALALTAASAAIFTNVKDLDSDNIEYIMHDALTLSVANTALICSINKATSYFITLALKTLGSSLPSIHTKAAYVGLKLVSALSSCVLVMCFNIAQDKHEFLSLLPHEEGKRCDYRIDPTMCSTAIAALSSIFVSSAYVREIPASVISITLLSLCVLTKKESAEPIM